jgi:putative addiction module component (TIGR02574 family)
MYNGRNDRNLDDCINNHDSQEFDLCGHFILVGTMVAKCHKQPFISGNIKLAVALSMWQWSTLQTLSWYAGMTANTALQAASPRRFDVRHRKSKRGARAVIDCELSASTALEVSVSTNLEVLEAEVLQLTPVERSHLLERLIASLDSDPEVEEAWEREADRREAELESGSVSAVSGQVAITRLRARIQQ